MDKSTFVAKLNHEWSTVPRWQGIERPYSAEDVWRLRGSIEVEYSVAKLGADRRGCRGRVRRPAARVRDHERHDRGRSCRSALRGPARFCQEVRPPGG